MKKSSNVLLSAVFLTSVASFMTEEMHAKQNVSTVPPAPAMQTNETDSTTHHHGAYGIVPHHGFFWHVFHRNPAPPPKVTTINDGPRRTEVPLDAKHTLPKTGGGFGNTGAGIFAHS